MNKPLTEAQIEAMLPKGHSFSARTRSGVAVPLVKSYIGVHWKEKDHPLGQGPRLHMWIYQLGRNLGIL